MVTIADVAVTEPVCVRATSTLRYCLRQLLTHGARHLPVLDDQGRLVGLVHDFQLLRHCDRRRRVPVVRPDYEEVPALKLAVSAGRTATPDRRLVDGLDMLTDGWEDVVVLVDDERHPVGLFTVNDALRLAPSWLTPWWRVRQAMTETCDALAAETPAREALRLLWRQQRAHALVMDGDDLVGAISLRELVAVDPESTITVRQLQGSSRARTVGPDTSLVDAARMLTRERRGCLPVIVNERARGLFTAHDMVRALRRTVNVAARKAS